jgi:hypothetical protein
MKYRLSLLLLPLLVQTSLAIPPTEQTPKGYLFRTIGVGVEAEDILCVDGKKLTPVTISTQSRSPVYSYESSVNPVVFGRMVPSPDGNQTLSPVAQAQLDPSSKRLLFVFYKIPTSNDHYGLIALPDNANSIPPGGYRFINFLGVPIVVLIGNVPQTVQPGTALIASPGSTEKPIYPVKVFLRKGTATVLAYSNIWSLEPDKRHLVLVAPSSEMASGVEVHRLSENVSSVSDSPNGY